MSEDEAPKTASIVSDEGAAGGVSAINVPPGELRQMHRDVLIYRFGIVLVVASALFLTMRFAVLPGVRALAGEGASLRLELTATISLGANLVLTGTVGFYEFGRRRLRRKKPEGEAPPLREGSS